MSRKRFMCFTLIPVLAISLAGAAYPGYSRNPDDPYLMSLEPAVKAEFRVKTSMTCSSTCDAETQSCCTS